MATVAEKNVLVAVIDVSQFYELSMSSGVQSQVVSSCKRKGQFIILFFSYHFSNALIKSQSSLILISSQVIVIP